MSIRGHQAWVWPAAGLLAVIAGVAVTIASTAYVAVFLAVAVIVLVFIWRFQEPLVPFLLLVAAMLGGTLLQLSLGGAPISTATPLLGAWAVVATLLNRRSRPPLVEPVLGFGRVLRPSLVVLATVVVVTGVGQQWRSGGSMLSLAESLTLVQLGVLVVLSAYLLTSPARVIWVGYTIVATCAVLAATALADWAGMTTSWFQLYYSGDQVRASGLEGDPNVFAFQLLMGLAFAAHMALAAKSVTSRILTWSACALLVAGIASTYSAGALVGLSTILVTTVILQLKVSVRRALVALTLIAAITATVAAMVPSDYRQAIGQKYTGLGSSTFEALGTGRGAAWEAAYREISSNPVLGVGLVPERRVREIAKYFTYYSTEKKAAHNSYLAIAVGAGIFATAAFIAVLASCFTILWTAHSRAAREGRSQATLALAGVFTGLAVIAIQGLQLDLDMDKLTWLLVGATLAVPYWSTEIGRKTQPTSESTEASSI